MQRRLLQDLRGGLAAGGVAVKHRATGNEGLDVFGGEAKLGQDFAAVFTQ